jgi:guanylate kinase
VSAVRKGIPFVIAAPSGTGKTTVCRRLVEVDALIEFSVSHTTRTPRTRERDSVHYHFVGREDFAKLAGEGAFLEWAEYNGNLYGTSWRSVEEPLAAGRDVLLEIEVQGAAQVRERRPGARFIFLLPPSMQALRTRLEQRGTDTPAEVERRLAWAEREELGAGTAFDYAVVNDELEACVAEVRGILEAERSGEVATLRQRFDPVRALARLREA